MWGSDHPVVTLFANLTDWVNATREIIAGASEDEQASCSIATANEFTEWGK